MRLYIYHGVMDTRSGAGCRRRSFRQQLLQLTHQRIEEVQRRIDGGGLFHVDAGAAEQIERVF